MAYSTTSAHLPALPETSLDTQLARQRLSPHWEPAGFERYVYQRALLSEMGQLGGMAGDKQGGNPDRYRPLSSIEA